MAFQWELMIIECVALQDGESTQCDPLAHCRQELAEVIAYELLAPSQRSAEAAMPWGIVSAPVR